MDESHIKNTFERRQYCIGYTTKISMTPTNLYNVNFIGPGLHINLLEVASTKIGDFQPHLYGITSNLKLA
jgi:hypothetical protein